MEYLCKKHRDLYENFPYETIRENQKFSLDKLAINDSAIFELPTGTGKTAIGYAFLKAIEGEGKKIYVVPTKVLADQVKYLHPDVGVVYGRGEYKCIFLTKTEKKADEVPCYLIGKRCKHRLITLEKEQGQLDDELELVAERGDKSLFKYKGEKLCPYYQAKADALNKDIVVCTYAFYVFDRLFVNFYGEPSAVVFDEVHNIANYIRRVLSHDLSLKHLTRMIKVMKKVDKDSMVPLEKIRDFVNQLTITKPTKEILDEVEIFRLKTQFEEIDTKKVWDAKRFLIESGKLDLEKDYAFLKEVEKIIFSIPRYLNLLKFALPPTPEESKYTKRKNPLNYVIVYYELLGGNKAKGKEKVKLQLKSHYVAGLIYKRLLCKNLVGYSATVGDTTPFGIDTGLRDFPIFKVEKSPFPLEHTRLYLPTDVPNLAQKAKSKGDKGKVLEMIGDACKRYKARGIRALVVVVSNSEKERFVRMHKDSLNITTYGNGVTPKQAVGQFKEGKGDVLVGTSANYAEGIDLPRRIAPVIFFLRPSYPSPHDPIAKFESKRFPKDRWKLWNWRVQLEGLQVRGRNIRTADDVGITFYMSRQFHRVLSLPKWLEEACRTDKSFGEAVEESLTILEG